MTGKKHSVLGIGWLLVFAIAGLGGPVSRLDSHSDATRLAAIHPGEQGPCATSSQSVSVDGDLNTLIVFPIDGSCDDHIATPYPTVIFAHGFSMFGFSDGVEENRGNGEHLASWGYVVAIPLLPDDFDARYAAMQEVLAYLEREASSEGSALYGKVDVECLAAAGHSLGGATALALASQDTRIRAVVALDPVYHTGGPGGGQELWDPAEQGPQIVVPTGILGTPGSACNADADYARIYPWVGATHKASFMLVDGSHCDLADPGNPFCSLVCGSADPARTDLSQTYMTAWFNYYLYLDTASYDLLYGAAGDADVDEGRIERHVQIAPRGLTAEAGPAICLSWTPYEHPIIAGYDVYRRLPGRPYAETPIAQVGRIGAYSDMGGVAGQLYSYTVRSRDPARNLHQAADEVAARAQAGEPPQRRLYLALITR